MMKYLYLGPALLLCLTAGMGCSAGRSAGLQKLDELRAGMTMESVIRELGQPTTLLQLESAEEGERFFDLTYVNTIVDSGVVELYFQPGLSEIRLNTELYRDFHPR